MQVNKKRKIFHKNQVKTIKKVRYNVTHIKRLAKTITIQYAFSRAFHDDNMDDDYGRVPCDAHPSQPDVLARFGRAARLPDSDYSNRQSSAHDHCDDAVHLDVS